MGFDDWLLMFSAAVCGYIAGGILIECFVSWLDGDQPH